FAAFERVEIGAPLGRDRVRIEQVFLVQIFDEGGVAARERGGRLEFLKEVRAHSHHRDETARRAPRQSPSPRPSGRGKRRIISARSDGCCVAAMARAFIWLLGRGYQWLGIFCGSGESRNPF